MSRNARQAVLVLRREARLELAGGEAALMTLPYVLVVIVLVGLGLDGRSVLTEALGPTVVWLAVLTTAAPLGRLVAAVEHDDGAWDLLRGLVSPVALVAGKVAALWAALLLTWAVTALLAAILLSSPLDGPAVLAALLGTLGLAVNTAVLGMVLGSSGRRTGLLAALVLPCSVPVLLAGTRVTEGAPALPWLVLLLVSDAVLIAAAWALAPLLLED